jgi:hypothetical protein
MLCPTTALHLKTQKNKAVDSKDPPPPKKKLKIYGKFKLFRQSECSYQHSTHPQEMA